MELTYFYAGARAMPVLCALHKGGIPCKLNTIGFPEFMAAKAEGMYKTGLPLLKLPSGKEITQSFAMARYVAKLPGVDLYPRSIEATLQMDVVMDIVFDIMAKCPGDPDQDKKLALRKEYAANRLLAYSKEIEATIGSSTFVAGDELTIGDLVLFFYTDMVTDGSFDGIPTTYFADHGLAKLEQLNVAIRESSVVTAWKESLQK
jgi:prostaglandin-H2 D-isomerase / glutathione transferase